MAKVKDLVMDIQEALVDYDGNQSFDSIAKELGVPVKWVEDEYEVMCEGDEGYYEPSEYDEWMDFDPAC